MFEGRSKLRHKGQNGKHLPVYRLGYNIIRPFQKVKNDDFLFEILVCPRRNPVIIVV